MELIEAIQNRKSIRGYKPVPVQKQILNNILQVASRAPSGVNTQPWKFTVVAGEALEEIKFGNIKRFESGESPHPDIPLESFTGIYKERQVDIAIQLFQLLGIAREDKEKRNDWMKKGGRFFDAPAAIIISVDKSLGSERVMLAIGAVAQTIALTALNYDLGTCIQDQGILYPEVVRKVTGIPESQRIAICLSIGYPDWDFPANKLESSREPVENCTTWCGI